MSAHEGYYEPTEKEIHAQVEAQLAEEHFSADDFDPEADAAEFHDKKQFKDYTMKEKDRVYTKYANKTVTWLERRGRVVWLNGEFAVLTQDATRLPINKDEHGILAEAVYRTTITIITSQWAKEIVGRVWIRLKQVAKQVRTGRHSLMEEKSIVVNTGSVVAAAIIYALSKLKKIRNHRLRFLRPGHEVRSLRCASSKQDELASAGRFSYL